MRAADAGDRMRLLELARSQSGSQRWRDILVRGLEADGSISGVW